MKGEQVQVFVRTDDNNYFKIKAGKLCSLLPNTVNTVTSFDLFNFKAALRIFLKKVPVSTSYTSANITETRFWIGRTRKKDVMPLT